MPIFGNSEVAPQDHSRRVLLLDQSFGLSLVCVKVMRGPDPPITPTAGRWRATASVATIHLGIRITQQDSETVLEGEAWCYTFAPLEQD